MKIPILFHNKWKAILFLVTSYYEYAVVGLATLFFVTTSSQQIVGESSITFLTISFGVFFALGIHNVIVRDGSLVERNLSKKKQLIKIEILFTIFVCVIVIFLMFFSRDEWFTYGLFIVAGNQLKIAAQTVSRVTNNDRVLNILNILWPSLFLINILIFKFLSIPSEKSLFISWGASLIVVSIPVLFGLFKVNRLQVFLTISDLLVLKQLLTKAKWFVVSMFATTLFISADRLFLNLFDYDPKFISIFQVSDVVSGIYFIGASTVLFYFTPNLLIKFASGISHFELTRFVLRSLLINVCTAFTFFVLVLTFEKIIQLCFDFDFDFDFDFQFYLVFLFMLLLKSAIISYGILGNYLLAKNKERTLAIFNIFLMVVCVLVTCLLVSFELAMYVSLAIFVMVVIFNFILFFRIVGENEENSYSC